MPSALRLTIKEANDLADEIERMGGNADSLRAFINEVKGNSNSSVPASNITDEEYLEGKRSQSSIERGTDLECTVCHNKFEYLFCGTCEGCFREWMLATKPKVRSRGLL